MLNQVPKIKYSDRNHFFLIAGPCAIESREMAFEIAEKVSGICDRLEIPYIFKGSYRKANRSRLDSFTGIGDDKALNILKEIGEKRDQVNLRAEINQIITEQIGPIAKLNKIQFTQGLPKTRSGKIMRRILRKIACNEADQLGDISTLLNPEVVQDIMDNVI